MFAVPPVPVAPPVLVAPPLPIVPPVADGVFVPPDEQAMIKHGARASQRQCAAVIFQPPRFGSLTRIARFR
jgi:hypothetical protein